jgi:putative ABC transport system permease protein
MQTDHAPTSDSSSALHWLRCIAQDTRYALRTLRRSPGFAVVAIVTLTLGIATTTAAFSVVDTVVLRGLPYRDAGRLMNVYERSDQGSLRVPSYPTYVDWMNQARTVSSAIEGFAFVRGDGVIMPTPSGDDRKIAAYVTPGFFALMGTRPLFGRTFLPDEERLGGPRVGVISYEYFNSQFGGDASIIGKTVPVDSVPTTIIGVMPQAFAYPNFAGVGGFLQPVIWQPIAIFQATHNQLTLRGLHVDSRAVLRLRSNADSAKAATVMRTIEARLAAEYPIDQAHWTGVGLQPIATELLGGVRQTLFLISGAIVLVLLLACANVANLLLVRASARSRELAVRSALGAGRWRLAQQLLIEAAVLAAAAGALGLLFASSLVGYVRHAAGERLPFGDQIAVNGRAALFALGAVASAALLVGALPAVHAGSRVMQRIRSGGAGALGGRREASMRNLLVSVQFALALTLLAGAGLLVQSFRRLMSVPLGYDSTNVVDFAIQPPPHRYNEPAQAAALYKRIVESLRATPGITEAAAAGGARIPVKIDTEGASGAKPVVQAAYHPVSSDYRSTLRIPMVAGRWFTDDDMRSPVGFVINQRLARDLWGSSSALGKRITVRRASQARADFGQPITLPVIGVIADAHLDGLDNDPSPELYLPYTLEVWPWMQFVVRVRNAVGAEALVTRIVQGVEPGVRFFGKPSLERQGLEAIDPQRRFVTFVLSGFAVCALLLATIGLYGIVAYSVVQRTRELGVRIALGATQRNVQALVMRDGMRFVIAGALVGTLGALAATRFIRSMLFETTSFDLATFITVPLLLAAAALGASYLSARRAARTDPLLAIRGE